MTFDYQRLSEPEFFAENRLAAHSDHGRTLYGEAAGTCRRFEQPLDGVWKFHYAVNPAATVPGFEAPGFDCSGWDDIVVPGHIQLQGYDVPQYVNVQYPWDGHEQLEPGQAPTRFNPVGSYVRTFSLDEPLAPGERLSVVFEGAESALIVWLNGVYVGYATDSFTPSEFDVTAALVDGVNKLACQVVKWCAASWCEDQDFFRFSGLFRGVRLSRRPACHAEDIAVTCELSDDCGTADLTVRVALTAPGTVTATLVDPPTPGPLVEGHGHGSGMERGDGSGVPLPDCVEPGYGASVTLRLERPHLWSAEDPYLYDLVVDVRDADGVATESAVLHVGVRRFGIEDGVLRINGRRVVFKGVNRHEFGPSGRVMTPEQTEAGIKALKAIGVNALRTCHYPNNGFLYDLCDRYGLYVIDEMNLESHGLWDRLRVEDLPDSEAVPGDRPEWLPMLLDRAASLLQRDKNHPCVVMWSCGNESYGGTDILAVSNYFREHDPSRPVHYEGVHWDPRYPETTDVVSTMYTPAAEIEEYLETHRDKPYLLCEYAHAMGNSFGAVDKYTELAYREPLYQGGFIWDFADQAVRRRDRRGQEYWGYGGDCGDRPHDGDFCGDGIFFADHTPSPKIQEVRYLYQPFRTVIGDGSFTVENRHLFTSTSVYDCVVSLSMYGQVEESATVPTDVAPGQTATYPLPFALPTARGEYAIDVSYRLRTAAPWAPAGHEVGWQQRVVAVPPEDLDRGDGSDGPRRQSLARVPAPELVRGIHNYGVRGEHFSALFSRFQPGPVSYRCGGRELLSAIPLPNFWHAPTSNERGWQSPQRDGQWLLASRYASIPGERRVGPGPVVTTHDDSVEIAYEYDLPTVPASQAGVAYRVYGDGLVEVTATMTPGEGLSDAPEFGLMFVCPADLSRLTWYGEGPEECYVDRRGGARLGAYEGAVADLLTPYLRPQEAGSRTGVRWATVTDEAGWGLRFTCEAPGMEFSALPWTPFEIENAAHPHDLPPIEHTVLRPALARRGVGGDNSWGAMTHPEYCLPTGVPLVFRFAFQGVREAR